jgi:hypothetical protein
MKVRYIKRARDRQTRRHWLHEWVFTRLLLTGGGVFSSSITMQDIMRGARRAGFDVRLKLVPNQYSSTSTSSGANTNGS